MSRDDPQAGEVYFEHRRIGSLTKVSAVDAATGTEISIAGPSTADPRALEKVALQKLLYVMSKK